MELPEGANMKPPGRSLYSFGGYYILAPDRVKSFNRLIQKALG
jgi:hypothetical protein